MTADIQPITDSNSVEMLSDRELAEETLRVLRSLDGTLAKFLGAFSQGGARGLRQAVRNYGPGPMAQALAAHGSLDAIPESNHDR